MATKSVSDKPEEYIELKADVPPENKGEMHPGKVRRFVTHFSSAAIKAEERAAKKNEVKEKIEKIKSVSLNKRSTKKIIEEELGSFESAIHNIINDEEKILEEQRRETKQINELRRMVENLSRKLIGVGKDYETEIERKDNKILELREALAAAHIKISESGEERQKKIEDIEHRIKTKQEEPPKPKSKEENIAELEEHLTTLETTHKELKKKGKHKKKDLDRVKKLIDKHKKTIKKIKKK
jgi:chromosome segregation ATPase